MGEIGAILVIAMAWVGSWSCAPKAAEHADDWEEVLQVYPADAVNSLFRAGAWEAARTQARKALEGHAALPAGVLVEKYITPPLHPLRYQALSVAALLYAREVHSAMLQAVKSDRIIAGGHLEAHLLLAGVPSLRKGCQEALALLKSSNRRTRLVGHVLMQLLTYRTVPPGAYSKWPEAPQPDVGPDIVRQWESSVHTRKDWSPSVFFQDAVRDLCQRWASGSKSTGTDPPLRRLIAHVSPRHRDALDVVRATHAGESFEDFADNVDLASYLGANSLLYWLIGP